MIRTSHRPLAMAALALGLLTLTACGTEKAGAGPGQSSPTTPASPTALSTSAAAARAAHDKAFPDVAARCKATKATAGTTGPEKPEPLPTDPEAAKFAENHAFKQQARLTPEARCRGEAHAQRIQKALTGPGTTPPANEAALTAALTKLGYGPDNGTVQRVGNALGFSYSVPGIGPCVTGYLGTPTSIEAHGPYVEGGCTEPRGGH
ncbi:hypothetical protein ACFYVL_02115 [Streptomyces sp. NPDC004111]|uniref:hypothetical protein n=1 Tax=Streptomyces sp. NPDC004111 TaxID=3364690 RepID=UPI003682E3DE